MKKTQLTEVQVLRAAAALAILLYHVTIIADSVFKINYLNNFFSQGYLGVDLFFVLGGFILFFKYEKDFGKTKIFWS